MKTKKLTRGKAIMSIMLALVLAGGFFLLGDRAFAAGGTVTVKVGNVVAGNEGTLPAGTTFTFKVYKVGEYDRSTDGTVVYKLDSGLAGASGVPQFVSSPDSFDKGTTTDEQNEWAKDWVAQADTLAKYINTLKDSDKPASKGPFTVNLTKDGGEADAGEFTVDLDSDGLYLLVGNEEEIGDYLWSPQPVFLSALNGSNKTFDYSNAVAQKMVSRKVVYEHNVIKEWNGDADVKDYVRPDKIAVKIMYGETLIDTVILDKEKDYRFSWKHKKLKTDADEIMYYPEGNTEGIKKKVNKEDAGWTVVELREGDAAGTAAETAAVKLRYYTTSYTPAKTVSDDAETITINNTFTCKYLKLKKTIDGYDGDGQNMTFSFKIVGKDSTGKEIYTNHVGVTFTQNDGLTKETIINYIPGAVETIEVEEEYSGNYKLVGDKVAVTELKESVQAESAQSEEMGTGDGSGQTDSTVKPKVIGWEATADNKHGDHGPKGGVVNRYDTNKDSPRQDPGKVPASQTETPDEGAN